ncbi:type II toxin-antitoxin system VapC family toxin [Nocardioides sp.]|uniref:type II toxin-antitoxin system VapC family toxin n=1 Tax=Nocardioides sp. TaxID=35761 RepID=UPI003565C1F7
MIAVDTNVLVYAHRADSDDHEAALSALRTLAEGGRPWGVPWPCLHEFLAVVTHPRIFRPPSTVDAALAAAADLLRLPGCTPFGEGPDHLEQLADLVRSGKAQGPRVHDARIAATCLSHGVEELWTADRDFARFPRLTTRNPLV